MNIYLLKLASLAIYPLSWVGLCLVVACIALFRNNIKQAKWMLALSILSLWAISMPITGKILSYQLEKVYPEKAITEIPVSDAILLLGGGTGGIAPPARLSIDLNDAADRVYYAARLYHAGKAPYIIASGGTITWQGTKQSEAAAMKSILIDLGVPKEAIIEEDNSLTTYENAVNSLPLLTAHNAQKVLVVTSAMHMPRALATMKKNMPTMTLMPASTDIRVVDQEDTTLLDWFPQASGLAMFTQAWHEQVGRLVYYLKGQA